MTSSHFCLWKFLSKNAKGYSCGFSYHQISGKIEKFRSRILLNFIFLLLWLHLATSSYGWSSVWLHHKIEPKNKTLLLTWPG
jgi:hypothetical protein